MTTAQEHLDTVKALCAEGESDDEHWSHKAELEAAYAAFAQGDASNPAPEGETPITADVVVTGDIPNPNA